MHTNNSNVVSDNLPIYFIWFGSDVPPKYFGNLQRAAETNKSRDIILVYSEKHLSQNNRKNIDSLESISLSKIQKSVKIRGNPEIIKRVNNITKNLWKIDVYNMELDKQGEKIYDLLDKVFKSTFLDEKGKEAKAGKFCTASDIIRLPLLNTTGGIYFDMDTEVIGEIGNLKGNKHGFYYNVYCKNNDYFTIDIAGNFLARAIAAKPSCSLFYCTQQAYFEQMYNRIINKEITVERGIDPANYLYDAIKSYYLQEEGLVDFSKDNVLDIKQEYDGGQLVLYNDGTNKRIDSETIKSVHKLMVSDYSVPSNLLSVVKFRMERGDRNNIDYSDLEQLRKLGLDKCANINSELENLSLEQHEVQPREK